MTKVDGSLKSLLQGVSQQPPRDRLPGQSTDQLNMSADPVTGLTRRPPTDLVGGLFSAPDVRGFQEFETSDGRKFLLTISTTYVRIFDLNGVYQTLNVVNPTTYLATPGKLAFGVINNQVLISNTGITPAMMTGGKAYANANQNYGTPMGIVQVLGGVYARNYEVFMNGNRIAMYRPPYGGDATDANQITTSHIANRLVEAMKTSGGEADIPGDGNGARIDRTGALSNPDWSVTIKSDVIFIKWTGGVGAPFVLSAADDSGNLNLKAMSTTVPGTEDLPRFAVHGYVARVATETDPDEDLWLEFRLEDSDESTPLGTGFGEKGYWQETVAPELDYRINPDTMPHIVEYDPSNQTFRYRKGEWKERRVGTDISNPLPSFIGAPITDITTFQRRTVFISGNSVSMSRTNRANDFFMASASQLVDSDPIDISSTAAESQRLSYIVPHNRDLVIFSNKAQFVITGRSALTPSNAAMVLTTSFETALDAKPVPAGRNVFFSTQFGRYSGVREFFTEGSAAELNDARPITQHVREFIVGKAQKMTASSSYDTLLVHTDTDRTTVYAYQYVWMDNEKVQAAWSRWIMPYPVVYSFFDQELLYMVMYADSGQYILTRMSLDVLSEVGVEYPLYLDLRFDVQDVYEQFALPLNLFSNDNLVVVQGENCPEPGLTVPIQSVEYDADLEEYVVTLKRDMEGGDLVVGVPYRSLYRPTVPLVKDQDGVVVGTSKLRVKHFIISLDKTGHIAGQVLSKYGDGAPVEFQGRIIGAPENTVGNPAISDEPFIMPFRDQVGQADFILYTDRHLPMTILDIEWVGQYSKRGRRITNGG